MANKKVFKSAGTVAQQTDVMNMAGGTAYSLTNKHELAQVASTGTFSDSYYDTAENQLGRLIELCRDVKDEYLAKVAIYSRQKGLMKDMPAFMCAMLAARRSKVLAKVFQKVLDNGRMLRNFCQMVRSGVTGRKSFGSGPKNLIRQWFLARTDNQLFRDSVGNDPSMADVIKMVHPKPNTDERQELYKYLIGKDFNIEKLPMLVRQFENFKKGFDKEVPEVPFQMLTGITISDDIWKEIAKSAGWTMTRMNLNTFLRHGVFKDGKMVELIAKRLADKDEVRNARVFPYQLFTAYKFMNDEMPKKVTEALQDAMEAATENVPEFGGKTWVFVDVSGSMHSPVTGDRGSVTTNTSCADVAALFASCVLRANKEAEVVLFGDRAKIVKLNPRDSVMTNTKAMAGIDLGGTTCSAPMKLLNNRSEKGDLIIYVSDNASWMDSSGFGDKTDTFKEWKKFKARNPKAKLVCIDIQSYGTTQAKETKNEVLNIGGFSDNIWQTIFDFVSGKPETNFVEEVEAIEI